MTQELIYRRVGRACLVMTLVTTAPAYAQEREEPVLAFRARVQVMFDTSFTRRAPDLADRWHTGRIIGQRCIAFAPDSVIVTDLRPDLPPDVSAPQLAVPLRDILRLRVSTKYDGRFVPGGPSRTDERGASIDGEEWVELPMDSVRLDDLGCGGEDEESVM